jgi:hypothetical protein
MSGSQIQASGGEPSYITVNGSNAGSALMSMVNSDEIEPGSEPGYQLCKNIYLYHALGRKLAEVPVIIAQSQARIITVSDAPPNVVVKVFQDEYNKLNVDKVIFNVKRTSRVYGISSVIVVADGKDPSEEFTPKELATLDLQFNVLDPLNTAGSQVLSQDPNSVNFQKPQPVATGGRRYHASRCCVVLNEEPFYIAYTTSAFGFVGRSVYQRALFPLKSFILSMITDDMVVKKCGLIVAKIKQPGPIMNGLMQAFTAMKRLVLQQAVVGNVLSVGDQDDVSTLNMQNLEGPLTVARKDILDNIATAASMPAKLLNSETFAEGFGEGTEDAKSIAQFIERERNEMGFIYAFFDRIVQYRAWTPEFYATIQADFEEYADLSYDQAFYRWKNSFSATWPSLLEEPESEKSKIDDVRLRATIALIETLIPQLDPGNKANLIEWAVANINEAKTMFKIALKIDIDDLLNYVPPAPPVQEPPPKPFSSEA